MDDPPRSEGEPLGPATLGPFRIVGRLGKGGMGVVYRAEDESLRRTVALKVLRAKEGDEEGKQRFLREARSAAAITHPNVAAVYQVGEADGRLYIAMELVEGENLRARLGGERLDVGTACELALQIATGLAAAHDKGIVHRDLKPENVMITPAGALKLLDFGLAKLDTHRSHSGDTDAAMAKTETLVTSDDGRVLGTPEYMSPEQVVGQPLDVRSDVFSFGVMLFEMLTGSRPFVGLTTSAVLVAIARDPAPALGDRAPGVDEALAAIVRRCLQKAPADRYANAREIVAALSGRSPSATTMSLTDAAQVATTRRLRRQKGLRLALAPLVGVALVGAALLAIRRSPVVAPEAGLAPSASAPAVVRIIDLPPPRTAVPAAAAEYAAGMQAMHDDNWMDAETHFAKAGDLDPSMAAAHLRTSMTAIGLDPVTRHGEFAKAVGLRASLGARDEALMEALQPYLQPQAQDSREAERRLRTFADRYPGDVEAWMWLAMIHHGAPEALAPAEHALAMDPADAQSWESKAMALLALGRAEEAVAAFDRCGALSMNGADCFLWKGFVDSVAGRCEEFERDARRAADRSPIGKALVVWALASLGARPEALAETVAQLVPVIPRPMGPELQRYGLEARLAFFGGDFVRASALAAQASATLAADPALRASYEPHYTLTLLLLDLALETGNEAEVRRIASDFVGRSAAWQPQGSGQGVDLGLYVLRLASPAGEAPPTAFEERRRAWIDARLAEGAYRGEVWNYAYASPAFTPAEARRAIDALGEFGPPKGAPSFVVAVYGRNGSPEADVGRLSLLAGRVDEAIPHLQRAEAACDIFTSTLDHLRATLDLGRALEQKGDRAGACDAYGKVLARWGRAKPRSVTADEARRGAKRLGCAAGGGTP